MDNAIELIKQAREVSTALLDVTPERSSAILATISARLRDRRDEILAANALDLAKMDPKSPDYDRLRLTAERIDGIAADMLAVSRLESPCGKTLSSVTRPNGMTITKVTVPFGVIGVIYESRPNVTSDVFALCFRAGSACVLKGGHEADSSSQAIVDIIHSVLSDESLPAALCTLLPPDRTSTAAMMDATGLIDVIIPRGGRGLISYVRDHSRVPVIETGAGVCHTYIDREADTAIGADIVFNAKTRRVSVCNALDCVIVHRDILSSLPDVCRRLADKNVTIYADSEAFDALNGRYPAPLLQHATDESFGTEFRDYKMAIRTVGSLDEALDHIARYGSHHSECIVSRDKNAIARFERSVDASCVYANVSTAFTDGAQFGFGAEIGISTQKLHARGPMALPELTTYKYIITGNGQTRPA